MHLIFQITPTHQLVEANVKIPDDPRASTMYSLIAWTGNTVQAHILTI